MLEGRASKVLAEVALRAQAKQSVAEKVAAIKAELYDKQLAVVHDTSREISVLGTRRAGKTELWTRITTISAIENARTLSRIWGINRLRCKQMIWEPLKLLCARHKLEVEPNETELTMKFANGSEIRLLGADKDKEVQKKRGDKTKIEIVLEAQLFGSYLKGLVEDVAGPCLFDLKGTFYLEGTPGPVCAGYWYDVSGRNDFQQRWLGEGNPHKDPKSGEQILVGSGWSCHRLDVLSNPFLPHAHEELALLKKKRRWDDEHPTYLREWRGRWTNDFSALYYSFDPIRNTFKLNEIQPWGQGWIHTLGWDLGFKDDMALVVWGYHPQYRELYEAYSWKKPGASMEEVMNQILSLEQRNFNLTAMYADTGGGGKMYVEEAQKRYPRAFLPAKKTEKYDHVRLMNDDLRSGFLKLQAGSPLAIEMSELQKDPDWPDPDKPEKPPTEDPRQPNHCCDAGLYSFRGAMHYLHRDDAPQIKPKTKAWYDREEAYMVKKLEDQRAKEDECWLNRYDSETQEDFLE